MNFTKTDTYIYNGETVEYHYSPTATYTEQAAFVQNVGNTIVSDNSYIPLLKDITFRFKLVQTFTDIDISQFADDEGMLDIDKFDEFDKETSVSLVLQNNIDSVMIENLYTSVDDYISYKTGMNKDTVATAITDLIKAFTIKVKAMYTSVDLEQAMDFIKKLGNSDINAESLVNAYLGSDSFKNNVASVVDAKNEQIKELQDKVNSVTAKNVVADKSDKVVPVKKGKK